MNLNDSQVHSLHRAGLGQYRPMGKAIAKCDELVERGLLGKNAQTGIYFLTEQGDEALFQSQTPLAR